MPFKKIETGIYSYYKQSDKTKKHISYYYSTTGADGKTIKLKSNNTDIRKVRKERASSDLREGADRVEVINRYSTLDEVAKAYKNKYGKPYVTQIGNKEVYHDEYKKYLKYCSEAIGLKQVYKITLDDVNEFKATLEAKGLQARPKLIQLKALLAKGGSSIKVKVDKVNDKIKKRYFTGDELARIFDMAERIHPELYFFMKMLLYTAQRPKNVHDLKVEDIHLDRDIIDFGEIKGQSEAEINISKKLRPLLKQWIKGMRMDAKVFSLSKDYLQELSQEIFDVFNKSLYYIEGMTKNEERQARKRAYKEKRHRWASFYGFRHTAATNIIKNTGSVFKAQQMLRHSDIKMTMIYAQDDDAQGTADAI